MTTTTDAPSVTTTDTGADHLRRLYFVRFVFAAAWAATFAGVGGHLDATSTTLLILYPAVDLAAALVDLRSSRNPVLYANIVLSAAATVAMAFAAADDIAAVLRVWGAWAITAGAVQLVVAIRRRALGGQWPMILSGGISVFAGAGFLGQAGDATSMTMVAGYAALGGIFFLVSAVRLWRRAQHARLEGTN